MDRIIEEASAVPDHRDAALTALLGRVGIEMEDASVSLKTVQDTLADLRPGCLSPEGIVGLQALDIVEQTVRALAKVVLSVSAAVASGREVDRHAVLADCEIASLAERLAGVAVDPGRLAAGDAHERDGAGAQPYRRTEPALAGSSPNGAPPSMQDVEFF